MQADRYAAIVLDAIKAAQVPLLERIDALTARLVAVEARSALPGRDGRDGAPGPVGERGPVGEHGAPGPVGERGPEGPRGLSGANGLDGEPGARGEVGPQGPQGETGPSGPQGVDGPAGAAGVDGARGETGPQGEAGPIGPQGPGGPQGEKGLDGLNGRDGTLEHLHVKQSDDFRTVTLCFKDGTPIEGGTLRFPAVIDRGVFRAGETFQPGDAVTYGGHLWIAKATTMETPGDAVTSWRLAVRRGREGKPGRDGKDLRDPPVVKARGRE